jgi:hypothetical protein
LLFLDLGWSCCIFTVHGSFFSFFLVASPILYSGLQGMPAATMMEPMDHKYDALEHIDDHHESGSNTEVDESLMGDEKQWQHQHHRPQTRESLRSMISSLFTTFRWTIDTALLITILILLLRNKNSKQQQQPYEFGGDFTGVAPRFSQQIVKFNMDPSYAPTNTSEFFTDAVLSKWNNLMPKGMGFVWVNDTHKYHDLPTPIEWPDKTVFTTSMTHQLHCLVSPPPFPFKISTAVMLTTATVRHRTNLLGPQSQPHHPG